MGNFKHKMHTCPVTTPVKKTIMNVRSKNFIFSNMELINWLLLLLVSHLCYFHYYSVLIIFYCIYVGLSVRLLSAYRRRLPFVHFHLWLILVSHLYHFYKNIFNMTTRSLDYERALLSVDKWIVDLFITPSIIAVYTVALNNYSSKLLRAYRK